MSPETAMRRTALSLALFVGLLQIPSFAVGQAPEPGGRRIVTTTRLVARYSDFEQQLTNAMRHKDEAALSRLLAEDFEQWTPDPPGDPLPREDWMHNALTAFTIQSFQLRQMAVRMVGDTAVVSFVLSQKAVCDGRECGGDSFIVDLWQEHKDAPQLLVRYASDIKRLPRLPSKPTGKE